MKTSFFALAALLLTSSAAIAGPTCEASLDSNAVRTEAPAVDANLASRDPAADVPVDASQLAAHFSKNLEADMSSLMESSVTVTIDHMGRDSADILNVSDNF